MNENLHRHPPPQYKGLVCLQGTERNSGYKSSMFCLIHESVVALLLPNSLISVFMDLALYTGGQSCWNRKGPSPNCSHKVGSMKLSKMSWYADALRVPFTGTRGSSPTPEKQPHTIIPPPPNDLDQTQRYG